MIWLILLLGAIIRLILLTQPTFHGDVFNHIDWGNISFKEGLAGFYERANWPHSAPNQPPGTIYLFWLAKLIFENLGSIFWFLNLNIPIFPSNFIHFYQERFYVFFLKLPSTLADLGITLLIYHFVKKNLNQKAALISASLFLFNPITFYNSAFWGQTDATTYFFAIFGIILLLNKKLFLGLLSITISLITKAQTLVFLPIILIILLKNRPKIVNLLSYLLVSLFFTIVLAFPFHPKNTLVWFFQLYFEKVLGQLSHLTENAFNLWAAIFGLSQLPENLPIFGVSATIWGWVLFAIFSLPLAYYLYYHFTPVNVFSATFLFSFLTFSFLTQMHERYLFGVFPTLAILTVFYPILAPIYFLLSAIHFLNLYNLWFAPRIDFLARLLSQSTSITILSFLTILILILTYIFLIAGKSGKNFSIRN